jgi:hypothetical protein
MLAGGVLIAAALTAAYTTVVPLPADTPVQVSQGQGGADSHADSANRYAIDLLAEPGTPVLAGFAGVVAEASGDCAAQDSPGCNRGRGNFVLIRAPDGTCSLSAHLATVGVAAGQAVATGEPVGTVGASGNASGPHLHYDRVVCDTGISLPWSFGDVELVAETVAPAPVETPTPAVTPPASAPDEPAPAARTSGTVDARVTYDWRRLRLTRLSMHALPLGAMVTLACSGRGCPVRSAWAWRPAGGAYNALKLVRRRSFKSGQTLDLRVAAPGMNTQVLRFRLRGDAEPAATPYCLPPDAKTLRRRCDPVY